MQPSAAGWCHFDHLYQRSRLHAVIPGKWSLSKKLVIWHLRQQDLPMRLGVFVLDLMVYVIRVLPSNPQRMNFSLPGIICWYHFAGGWRRIKKVLPEHVDIFPQGPARLRVSRRVTLFQPSPRRLCGARRWLARNKNLRTFHKQLVRYFLFPFFFFLSTKQHN